MELLSVETEEQYEVIHGVICLHMKAIVFLISIFQLLHNESHAKIWTDFQLY